ncbi:MAG: Stp1/IreP family PP2C-type Ser/Thr phosphatase [Anaerolineae bacterium]|nr:Stp1/IreP family PP2C-type Ser/Thr phosphatase [Anaerolineae bacterium]
MNCPKCGHPNRAEARVCEQCGQPLSIVTPSPAPPTRPLSHPPVLPPSQELPATTPLPQLSELFAPLPEGALLKHRYIVQAVQLSDDRLNVYVVEDLVSARRCPNCGAIAADPQEHFCASCGADLSGVGEVNLRYRVHESADVQAFAAEAQLLGLKLNHAALLLPVAVFTDVPYGQPRQYRVDPEFFPAMAATLPIPQEMSAVLEWGTSLAQAMGYLHQHQVVLRTVGLNYVAVDGHRAFWTNLNSYLAPPDSPAAAVDGFAQDVKNLALLLLYLVTGQQQLSAVGSLPPRLQEVVKHALTNPQEVTAFTLAAELKEALQGARRPESITLRVGRRTDVGRVRSLNEDSLLTLETSRVYRSLNQPVGVFAVADGMGGHEAGDVASQLTCRVIGQLAAKEIIEPAMAEHALPDSKAWLISAVQTANQAVYEERTSAGNDMGNTLVMALLVGNVATIANIGDSRCYLLTREAIMQVTTDHSLVERLVSMGQLTKEEAAHHPQKNVIYRVIGDKPNLEVDLYDCTLLPGQALLFCSDGLSGMVPDQQIWQHWRASTSPQESCDRLVEAANQAGGEDNITVVIVQVTA